MRANTPSCHQLVYRNVCCNYLCSVTGNNFLLYDIDIQQSILISYCASITEMEGNTIVVNSKNKIKKERIWERELQRLQFPLQIHPYYTYPFSYLFRYKVLKFLFCSPIYKPFLLSFVICFRNERCFTDLLAFMDTNYGVRSKRARGDKQDCPMKDPDSFSGLLGNKVSGTWLSYLTWKGHSQTQPPRRQWPVKQTCCCPGPPCCRIFWPRFPGPGWLVVLELA